MPAPRPARTDGELLAQIALGEIDGLGELYERHRDAVRSFVLRATRHHDDAEDLVQTVFLTAARIADRYDGRPSARPWLVGIAGRLVQQRGQRFARLARYLARLASQQSRARDPRPVLEARSELDAVGRALADMGAGKRVTIIMAEVEAMSCPEIAAELGIPVGTVWRRLHQARQEIAAALEGR
jgi:RNA polymerase sigma-70 factor (ECF subfamily)